MSTEPSKSSHIGTASMSMVIGSPVGVATAAKTKTPTMIQRRAEPKGGMVLQFQGQRRVHRAVQRDQVAQVGAAE